MSMKQRPILDASAVLALLFREPGAEVVAEVFAEAAISAVNAAEVASRFARDGFDGAEALRRLEASPLEIVPFTAVDAARVADLAPRVRARGLSLGDRACLALAARRGAPVLTADRAWLDLEIEIEVRSIR